VVFCIVGLQHSKREEGSLLFDLVGDLGIGVGGVLNAQGFQNELELMLLLFEEVDSRVLVELKGLDKPVFPLVGCLKVLLDHEHTSL